MVRVRVRRNFSRRDLLRDISISKRTMRAAGQQIAEDVRDRTRAGVDAEGRPFAPHEGEQAGERVDLADTGQMLRDLEVLEATEHGVKVGFRTARSERLAALHEQGTRHMPARPFLALSSATIERVMQILRRGRR